MSHTLAARAVWSVWGYCRLTLAAGWVWTAYRTPRGIILKLELP